MNTFKKLMFGLLLSGMAFTAACGDTTGDKIKEGQACKKEDTCDGKLKCVVKDEKDTKGTCQKVCTKATETADCGADKTCSMDVKTLDKKGAKQCKAKTDEPVALGEKCVAGNTCADDGKCLVDSGAATEGVCTKACVDGAACAAADATKPLCKPVGMILGSTTEKLAVCVAKIAKGQPCAAADECAENLKCVIAKAGAETGTCMEPCTGPATCAGNTETKQTACESVGMEFGATDRTIMLCVVPAAQGTAEPGSECDLYGDATKTCKPTTVCVEAGPQGTVCASSCGAAADDSGECKAISSELPKCANAKLATDGTDSLVCQPAG